MKLRRILGILVITSAIAFSGPADSAKKPDTLFYEARLSCPQGDMGTRKMWMKDSNFTCEVDSAGLKRTVIKNEDGVFMVNLSRMRAAKYPPGTTRESPMSIVPGPVGDVKAFLAGNDAKKTGQEKINDKPCTIYKYKEKLTKWNCKLWVHSTSLLPVKLVMTGQRPQDNETVTYVTYKRGVDIPDSRFQLPKGITIAPMSVVKDRPASSTTTAPAPKPEGVSSKPESPAPKPEGGLPNTESPAAKPAGE